MEEKEPTIRDLAMKVDALFAIVQTVVDQVRVLQEEMREMRIELDQVKAEMLEMREEMREMKEEMRSGFASHHYSQNRTNQAINKAGKILAAA
jgi:phage shock protein A